MQGKIRFAVHYLEMIAAMFVGMLVLGAAVRAVVAIAGLDYSHEQYPVLSTLEMAFTMSVGMVAWMRYRGHGWASALEMTAAMFVPAIAVLPLLWLDLLSGHGAMMLTHIAMPPLMLIVMLRRRAEFTAPHNHPAPA